MSTTKDTQEVEKLRKEIQQTHESHMSSRQALDAKGRLPAQQDGNDEQRHNDGEAIYQRFSMTPFFRQLEQAARQGSPVAEHPQALPHLVAHLSEFEKWELGKDAPDLEALGLPRTRERVLEWFAEDEDRLERLRDGGTELLIHGEQGSTKTTLMLWLVITILQVNPVESVFWLASLDDVEWSSLGPWATVWLPEDVTVDVTASPYARAYSSGDSGQDVELDMSDLARDVQRYNSPEDLFQQVAQRTPGQIHVVYPDPHFRRCEGLVGYPFTSAWDAGETTEITPLKHWWFGFMEQYIHGSAFSSWATAIGDEAHKWLHQSSSDGEHMTWSKVQDFATAWGDARKGRQSLFLAIHQWKEMHDSVRDKMRWGATMNGEDYPAKAPLNGSNDRQGLGETAIWASQKWNHIGYPNLKKHVSVPASIDVTYPDLEVRKHEIA